MLTTNDKNVYEYVQKLIAHGIDKNKKKNFWDRIAVLPGHNFRMPNHLAALGQSQLKKLVKFNYQRNKIAKLYTNGLSKISNKIFPPKIPKGYTHSFQMYTIRVNKKIRKKLVSYLKKNHIEASVHFDPPLHKMSYLKKFYKKRLPTTEKLCKELITLPIYPEMGRNEVNYVLNKIKTFYKN